MIKDSRQVGVQSVARTALSKIYEAARLMTMISNFVKLKMNLKKRNWHLR